MITYKSLKNIKIFDPPDDRRLQYDSKEVRPEHKMITPFEVPVALIRLNDWVPLENEKLIGSVDLKYFKSLKRKGIKHDIDSSVDDRVLDSEPLCGEFKRAMQSEVNSFARDVLKINIWADGSKNGEHIDITSSWVNYAKRGQGHAKRTHGNSLLSGVFFIDVEKSVPLIKFDTPLPSWGMEWKRRKYNPVNSLSYELEVKNGDLVLFPSWLTYWVPPNETRHERITLTFETLWRGVLYNDAGTDLMVIE